MVELRGLVERMALPYLVKFASYAVSKIADSRGTNAHKTQGPFEPGPKWSWPRKPGLIFI